MACEVKNVKLSVIGLSCLQKLISHDAVAPSALKEILSTLKDVRTGVLLKLHYADAIHVFIRTNFIQFSHEIYVLWPQLISLLMDCCNEHITSWPP